MEIRVSFNEVDYTVEFDYRPAVMGRIWGPPEVCFPDESEEIDLIACTPECPAEVADNEDFIEACKESARRVMKSVKEEADEHRAEQHREARLAA